MYYDIISPVKWKQFYCLGDVEMIFKDYYKILGLQNNKASQEEIKIAFREQAKKYHPDVSNNSRTEERFKDINEAYKVLTRRSYEKKIWQNVE